jgi:hypothetical protein
LTDDRPRIQIWCHNGLWAWQDRVGPAGTHPRTEKTPGDALRAALDHIEHKPAVIFYGPIPQAPRNRL